MPDNPPPPTPEDVETATEVYQLDSALEASGWRDTVYRSPDGCFIHEHEKMEDWDFSIRVRRSWLTESEATELIQRLKEEEE